jgi:hypothetical protein
VVAAAGLVTHTAKTETSHKNINKIIMKLFLLEHSHQLDRQDCQTAVYTVQLRGQHAIAIIPSVPIGCGITINGSTQQLENKWWERCQAQSVNVPVHYPSQKILLPVNAFGARRPILTSGQITFPNSCSEEALAVAGYSDNFVHGSCIFICYP